MKLGTLTFTTDGDTIAAFFTDQEGNSTSILRGRSLGDCNKAISQMVLLMQHRNGILNYNEDGSIADRVTESIIPDLEAIRSVDKGTGWC